ncbi:alcohol dehydrogenase-like protein [Byssothecium circinans]|uniref:alcohol dehydrogenase (NADP(+)) n=1 Tax=Byssothecium circinans TaxID=147558 RepID=A0A6A5UDE6_9PLEO|nr:alcohol dehydrogenase-like protein [Byssothecium circinans]
MSSPAIKQKTENRNISSPESFHGWLGHDAQSAKGKLRWESFAPKPFAETDIDIKISHCGICGTDLHTLRSGWFPTHYPICVGHKIIGHVTRVGSAAASRHKIGDRVGVGAQAFSCQQADCEDGYWSMGGYADYVRVPAAFAIKIPEQIKSEDAAPMMCGGVTVYSPLKRHGAGPGKKVRIVGFGGLGHFGVLFAHHLGCDKVVVISRRRNKEKDALAMGATDFIATSEDEKWEEKHSRSLDLIVSTVSSPDLPLASYLELLRPEGQFIQVGAPEDKLPPITALALILKRCKIGGSQIWSPREIEEMLKFAAEKNIKPWIQTRPMKDANQSIVDMEGGKARYRYVLVNEEEAKARS